MKIIVYISLIFLFVCFVPIVAYDQPEQSGVICIEHKPIGSWLVEQYEIFQQKRNNR